MRGRTSRRTFTPRDKLNKLVQKPSVFELYDLMHVTSCELVCEDDKWDVLWQFCPVCGCRADDQGFFTHVDRRDSDCLT